MFGQKVKEHGAHQDMGTRIAQAWRRMLSSNEELDSQDLQQACRSVGAVPISSCADREKVTLSGTVSRVVVDPSSPASGLEVEVRDGSGAVTLVWLGRKRIPGIDAGRTVRVTGRVSCQDGRRVMYNPAYELL